MFLKPDFRSKHPMLVCSSYEWSLLKGSMPLTLFHSGLNFYMNSVRTLGFRTTAESQILSELKYWKWTQTAIHTIGSKPGKNILHFSFNYSTVKYIQTKTLFYASDWRLHNVWGVWILFMGQQEHQHSMVATLGIRTTTLEMDWLQDWLQFLHTLHYNFRNPLNMNVNNMQIISIMIHDVL